MVQRLFLSFFCFFTLICSVFSQLQVASAGQPPYTPEVLVSNFMTGAGINVIDISYVGDSIAVGYFKNGTGSIGLDRGLILTSGRAATVGISFGADGEGADFANTSNFGGSIEPNFDSNTFLHQKNTQNLHARISMIFLDFLFKDQGIRLLPILQLFQGLIYR
jgi:hypothetical protein